MRVSVRFQFAIGLLIVAMAMSAFSLGSTAPAAAHGSQRYIVLGVNEQLPAGFEAMVAAVGGRVVEVMPEIGVAVVESDEPSFEFAAGGIRGVEAVAEDVEVFIGAPVSDIVVESEAAPEGVVVEGHNPQLARFFLAQWAMRAIHADDAWAQGYKGSPSVDVAVLDTGIDYTHQELAGKVDMVRSKSYFTEALSPLPPGLPLGTPIRAFLDFNGHGTFVATLIAGKGISVAGVAPHVNLIAVKVGGRNGFAPWSAIILAIRYAADSGADIINMSFGSRMTKDELKAGHLKQALKRATKYAERRGAFLVASAGNDATDWDREDELTKVPAQFPEVNAVSATGPTNLMDFNTLTPYSDFGRSIIDFAAPGGNATPFRCLPVFDPPTPTGRMVGCTPLPPVVRIVNGKPVLVPDPAGMAADRIISACSRFVAGPTPPKFPTPGFPCGSGRANVFMIGTSMSAAIVSGVAAIADGVAQGALDGDQIRRVLMQTAVDLGRQGHDAQYGFGFVNALAAARCVQQRFSMSEGEAKVRNCH